MSNKVQDQKTRERHNFIYLNFDTKFSFFTKQNLNFYLIIIIIILFFRQDPIYSNKNLLNANIVCEKKRILISILLKMYHNAADNASVGGINIHTSQQGNGV